MPVILSSAAALGAMLLVAGCGAAAQAPSDPPAVAVANGPTAAERATSMAEARERIAQYRHASGQTDSDRCFTLKQVVRALRDGGAMNEQQGWNARMQRVCAHAGKSTDL